MPVAVAPQPDPRAQLGAALESCRTLLATEHFEEASRAAQAGLVLDATDADLTACRQQADVALRADSAYQQGKKALGENKLEDAYFMFAGIPEGSAYSEKADVRQTMQRVAIGRLSEARQLLKSNSTGARDLATSVLDMYGLTSAMVEDANHILALAARGTAAPSAPRARAAAPDTAPAPAATPVSEEESPAKLARNCLARGDQRCAVRALEGHAENAQELALLIETYRALGETKKAVRHMESFVELYPTARQAPQYRQFITKHDQ
jgi:hypothetical protein